MSHQSAEEEAAVRSHFLRAWAVPLLPVLVLSDGTELTGPVHLEGCCSFLTPARDVSTFYRFQSLFWLLHERVQGLRSVSASSSGRIDPPRLAARSAPPGALPTAFHPRRELPNRYRLMPFPDFDPAFLRCVHDFCGLPVLLSLLAVLVGPKLFAPERKTRFEHFLEYKML